MTSRLDPWKAHWKALRDHAAFQVALVFGGAAWLVLQVADVVGMPLVFVRLLGASLFIIFAGLLGYALFATRSARPGGGPALRGRGRALLATAAALVVLGTAAWWARLRILRGAVKPGADVIAVLPFTASGDAVEVLREGMVDLLSKDLDGVGGIRVVDPRSTLSLWRRAGGAEGLDLKASLNVGRALQAGSILTGSVVAAGDEVRMIADLIGVDGQKLADAQASGQADSVLPLVDQLSTDLLRDIWKARAPIPSMHVAAITSSVPGALRAYLRGEHFYRRSQWDSAAAAFEDAVQLDSTFALAHFRLGMSSGWLEFLGSPSAREHAQAAVRFAARLPPRERMLMEAQELHEAGNPAALDTLTQYVRKYPDDADGWQYLGDVQFHASPFVGEPYGSAGPAFDRAIALDSTAAPAYVHQLDEAAMRGDSARFNHYFQGFAAHASAEEADLYGTVRQLLWGPAGEILATFRAAIHGPLAANGNNIETLMTFVAIRTLTGPRPDAAIVPELLDTATAVLDRGMPQAALRRPFQRFQARLGQGQLQAAGAELDTILQANPAFARSVIFFLYNGLTAPALGMQVLDLMPLGQSTTLYWKTVAALAAGDSIAARSLLASPQAADSALEPTVPPEYLEALRAWTTIEDGDTTRGLPRLQSSLLAAGYSRRSLALRPALVALARIEAARPETRTRGIDRLQDLIYWDPWPGIGLNLPLARALEAEGRRGEAAAAYSRFVTLWQDADPELQPLVAAARQALERIVGEPHSN